MMTITGLSSLQLLFKPQSTKDDNNDNNKDTVIVSASKNNNDHNVIFFALLGVVVTVVDKGGTCPRGHLPTQCRHAGGGPGTYCL
jgi:hypothetical protein